MVTKRKAKVDFTTLQKAMDTQTGPQRGGEGEYDQPEVGQGGKSEMKRTTIYIDTRLWDLVRKAAKAECGSTGASV